MPVVVRARRRPSRPDQARAALLAAAALLLAGCSDGPVRATPFGASDSPPCRAVADRWPAEVAHASSRETAVQSRGVAAWGDPAIVARCGKQPPGPTTDQCLDVSGVDWVAHPLSDGTMFTTFGRDPAIEVLVPKAYPTPALLLPAFDAAARQVPQTLGKCS